MVVEIACTCDGLPSHSHLFTHTFLSDVATRHSYTQVEMEPFDVRIWVDWKTVAREQMRSEAK
jgi:hypothetical protein